MSPTIKTFQTLEDARETWKEFQDRGSAYTFQTCEWAESWYLHIGRRRGVTPVLVAVYDDEGEAACFFAFGIESRGPLRTLTWLGEPLNDYGAPIIVRDTQGFPEVWSAIQRSLPPVDVVRLKRIPDRVNDAANPMRGLRCRRYHSSAHFVRLDGTWNTFYEKHAGAKTRSTDRRKQRRLADEGNITYEINLGNDRPKFDALARTMIEQKARRYREMNARNILANRGCREFFAVPAEELVASGRLHLSGLFVDRDPVTIHWGMVHQKRFYYYMPSLASARWRKYSPGRLLLCHLLEWCFDNGIEVFDFTIGDEPYKKDWCDEEMPLYEYFEARTPVGKLYGVYYRLMKAALDNTVTLNLARRARALFYRLRNAGS